MPVSWQNRLPLKHNEYDYVQRIQHAFLFFKRNGYYRMGRSIESRSAFAYISCAARQSAGHFGTWRAILSVTPGAETAMKRFVILLVGLLIIGSALGIGAWQTGRWTPFADTTPAGTDAKKVAGKDGKSGKGSRPPAVVRTARVEVTPMPVVIDVVGTIESEHVVSVRPQVSGLLDRKSVV
jgi:hypothetical protein